MAFARIKPQIKVSRAKRRKRSSGWQNGETRMMKNAFALAVIATGLCSMEVLSQETTPAETPQKEAQGTAPGSAKAPAKPKWPKYNKMRFKENYSKLGDAEHRDFFDALKHINIDEDEGWYLDLGGQARIRFENFQSFNFGSPGVDDDNYTVQRYFLHGDMHFGENVRIFTEVRSSLVNDWDISNPQGNRPLSQFDEFDVQNAFIDFNFEPSSDIDARIRAGRFEMEYGVGRIVGCRNFSQTRRPFDGGALKLSNKSGWIEGFYANWVKAARYDWFNETNSDQTIWGAYAHLNAGKESLPANIELYAIGKDNETGTKNEHRMTIGGRIFNKIGDSKLSYDIEGAYQFDYSGTEVQAGMFSAQLMYKDTESEFKPWITGGFDWASGDDDPTDMTIKTFEPVSGFGHFYFGYADQIGRQNIVSPWLTVGAMPMKQLTTSVEAHWFWVDEAADGIYAPSNVSARRRAGSATAGEYIGFELDFVAKYKINHHMVLLAGFSHLWAGEFIDDTAGGKSDVSRLYTQLQFTF